MPVEWHAVLVLSMNSFPVPRVTSFYFFDFVDVGKPIPGVSLKFEGSVNSTIELVKRWLEVDPSGPLFSPHSRTCLAVLSQLHVSSSMFTARRSGGRNTSFDDAPFGGWATQWAREQLLFMSFLLRPELVSLPDFHSRGTSNPPSPVKKSQRNSSAHCTVAFFGPHNITCDLESRAKQVREGGETKTREPLMSSDRLPDSIPELTVPSNFR
jgi:hypothetical protein